MKVPVCQEQDRGQTPITPICRIFLCLCLCLYLYLCLCLCLFVVLVTGVIAFEDIIILWVVIGKQSVVDGTARQEHLLNIKRVCIANWVLDGKEPFLQLPKDTLNVLLEAFDMLAPPVVLRRFCLVFEGWNQQHPVAVPSITNVVQPKMGLHCSIIASCLKRLVGQKGVVVVDLMDSLIVLGNCLVIVCPRIVCAERLDVSIVCTNNFKRKCWFAVFAVAFALKA